MPDRLAMGNWSDGEPVKPMTATLTAPEHP